MSDDQNSSNKRFSPANSPVGSPDASTNTDSGPSFLDLMSDVTPIKHDKVAKANTKRLRKRTDLAYLRAQAVQEQDKVIDGLSSEVVEIVESDEELIFATSGIQIAKLKRLRKGHIPWEAGIDLHGMTVDEARDELSKFIRDSTFESLRCVIVVHGKAYSQAGKQPVLKSYVNDWLRQLPQVLAFASAQARDGGTGALYVLLRQSKS